MNWQLLGYVVSIGSLSVGASLLVARGVVAFFDWLYPDKQTPEDIAQAGDVYLAKMAGRVLKSPFHDESIAR